jgi:hypothetical protein
MNIVRYLPSAQFVVIVSSIAISGGLVVAAQKFTGPPHISSSLTPAVTTPSTAQTDWMANLRTIEGSSIDTTTSAETTKSTDALLAAAKSSNLTDTVARTLFINLSAAKSQGLGSDIPTQDKLIADAVTQIKKDRTSPTYSAGDLTISANTQAAFKAYGNAVIKTINLHPAASFNATVYAVGDATDHNEPSRLAPLRDIQNDYAALAQDLAQIPVPQPFVPLHLQIVNNIDQMAQTFSDMRVMFDDPLRGLAGLQLYQALNDESARVFTNLAQQFSQDGILFTKDEPGSAWGSLLSL